MLLRVCVCLSANTLGCQCVRYPPISRVVLCTAALSEDGARADGASGAAKRPRHATGTPSNDALSGDGLAAMAFDAAPVGAPSISGPAEAMAPHGGAVAGTSAVVASGTHQRRTTAGAANEDTDELDGHHSRRGRSDDSDAENALLKKTTLDRLRRNLQRSRQEYARAGVDHGADDNEFIERVVTTAAQVPPAGLVDRLGDVARALSFEHVGHWKLPAIVSEICTMRVAVTVGWNDLPDGPAAQAALPADERARLGATAVVVGVIQTGRGFGMLFADIANRSLVAAACNLDAVRAHLERALTSATDTASPFTFHSATLEPSPIAPDATGDASLWIAAYLMVVACTIHSTRDAHADKFRAALRYVRQVWDGDARAPDAKLESVKSHVMAVWGGTLHGMRTYTMRPHVRAVPWPL